MHCFKIVIYLCFLLKYMRGSLSQNFEIIIFGLQSDCGMLTRKLLITARIRGLNPNTTLEKKALISWPVLLLLMLLTLDRGKTIRILLNIIFHIFLVLLLTNNSSCHIISYSKYSYRKVLIGQQLWLIYKM